MNASQNTRLAVGLVRGGVFRKAWMDDLGYGPDEASALCVSEFGVEPLAFSGGWNAVVCDDTVAGRTVLRVAGALFRERVPCGDLAEAVIKMVRYGVMESGGKRDAALGKDLAEFFTALPPQDLLIALAVHVGASCLGSHVDFSEAERCIMPTQLEAEIVNKLVICRDGYAPTSWLSRRLESRPSRTSVDYTILPAVPFLLKADKGPARLLGVRVPENEISRGPSETFVGLTRSPCGNRIAIEYRVNEEAVEGNSFNVRPDWRELVHGTFTEVNTGRIISYDRNGRDARKLIGVGKIIRSAYPDYETGESAIIVIDRAAGTASVEVGRRYGRSFESRIASLMGSGIVPRQSHPLPEAA